ncbi:MAG: TonB-dependent receptor [Pseudomonadota bacterium]
MTHSKNALSVIFSTALGLGAGVAIADETSDIDIAAQTLRGALTELSRETGLSIGAPTDLVDGIDSDAITGTMTPRQALAQLLEKTDLTFSAFGDDSVVVQRSRPFDEVVTQNADDEPLDLGTLVITTARRTEEDVKDVPGSVQVFNGERLERSNIGNFADAIQQLPNVNIASNSDPFRGIISIRGISSQNILSTAPTIGVFQNGVLQNSTGLRHNINPRLIDLERVEVLFGPQGTAFGRGTIGGAINYVTAKPKFETEGSVRLSYNDLDEGTAEIVYNTPLSETVALRLVAYGAYADGFVDSPFSPDTSSLGTDDLGTRVSLRFQPNDRLTVDASVQYDEASYDAPLFVFESSNAAGNPLVGNNAIPGGEVRRTNVFLEVAYETGIGTIKSTTGYLESDLDSIEDFDFSPVDADLIERDNIQDTFSQEIRLESRDFDLAGAGTLSFNLGANYSQTDSRTVADFQVANFNFMGFPLGPGSSNSVVLLDVENYGIFGDVRWRPVEPLEITVGGRYSHDRVDVNSSFLTSGSIATLLPSDTVVDSASFSEFTPNISVLYDWTDSFSTYATYSTGYKPGGFAGTLAGQFLPFDEERSENFEIGLRADLFDGALEVNASVFTVDYDDIQVPIPASAGGGIDNAAGAQSDGIELSFLANPISGLTISGGIAFTDSRFTDFPNAAVGRSLTGTRLPNAPRRTFNLTADYEFQNDFNGFTPFVRGEFSGTSSFTSLAGDTMEVGDYNLFNLRTGLRGDQFDFTVFVENLFDERYNLEFAGLGTAPAQFAGDPLVVPGKPRTIGFVASARF